MASPTIRSLSTLRDPFLRPPTTPTPAIYRLASTVTSTPQSGSPFMSRQANRPLPDIPRPGRRWARTLPIFFTIITLSALGIFNYQKASSSVVSATLYALRTSPRAREVLGDEIYFRDKVPWIWGELNQLHGKIDVRFGVKGKKAKGMMRFRSVRKGRIGYVSLGLSGSRCWEGSCWRCLC